MQRCGVLFVLLLAALTSSTSRASVQKTDAFAHWMIEQVSGVARPCDKEFSGTGSNAVFLCAAVPSDFKTFREAWNRAISQASTDARPLADWTVQGSTRMCWYDLKDRWLVVTYLGNERRIVLSYPGDREGTVPLSKAVTPPKRTEPGNPLSKSAKGPPSGGTGVVVISAVIQSDGTVGDAEVLGCAPLHKGLEEAALKAVTTWRYEPARKDGVAVAIPFTVTVSYGPAGQRFSETSSPTESPAGFGPMQ